MTHIDEDLHSRQLAVYGRESMARMANANVCILGLKGLGAEIAKNVILAGVRSVTLIDSHPVEIADLGAHFYLAPQDVGRLSRAAACSKKLADLNPAVKVRVESIDLAALSRDANAAASFVQHYQCVVATELLATTAEALDAACHAHRVPFIRADVRGVFASVFCDFGPEFLVHDANGEEPHQGIIASITPLGGGDIHGDGGTSGGSSTNQTPRIMITCVEDSRLEFEEGDDVIFTEVIGLEALNDGHPRRVLRATPTLLEVAVEPHLLASGEYRRGGLVVQVKKPKTLSFKSMREAREAPGEFVLTDFAKFEAPAQLHLGFMALDQFSLQCQDDATANTNTTNSGSVSTMHLPRSYHLNDATQLLQLASSINATLPATCRVDTITEPLLKALAYTARGYLNPMAALLGGLVGQEVVKAVSGKFHPIQQYLYFDAIECLPNACDDTGGLGRQGAAGMVLYEPNNPPKTGAEGVKILSEEQVAPRSSRYDAQIAVFGYDMQCRLEALKVFLVGAGALGCELMKNFALMGLGCSEAGSVSVTDDDQIERSNLSRQFLFREQHIGKPKSFVAASAARDINEALHIIPLQNRVCPETESVFNDAFWEPLDLVVNALDNVNARLYVDQRCVYYTKPLLESGTLGPKCNTQMVLPHMTENYGASRDPPEKSAPMCTVHSFPHNIDHCLVWARSEFEGMLEKAPSEANEFLENGAKFLSEVRSLRDNASKEKLEKAVECLVDEAVVSYEDCLVWARNKFQAYFVNKVLDLTTSFPEDALTREGGSFWAPPKRFPHPVTFEPGNELAVTFVAAAARLKAEMHGIERPAWAMSMHDVATRAASIHVPAFVPRKGTVVLPTDDKSGGGGGGNENSASQQQQSVPDDASVLESLAQRLEGAMAQGSIPSAQYRLSPIQFEKDNDDNGHMDLITSLANLRARNYHIQEVDKLKAKLIAGRIIPAIATATALATGLVCLEVYKILLNKPMESYRNAFINLALPLFTLSEPVPAKKLSFKEMRWSLWDRWMIHGDPTLQQLLAWFEDKGLEPYSVSAGQALLYNNFMPKHKERLGVKVSELYKTVAKLSVQEGRRHVDVVVACEDPESGEDVDVPLVSVQFA